MKSRVSAGPNLPKGFFMLPDGVMYNRDLNERTKLVYAVLLRYATAFDGEVFPAQKVIADHLGCSPETVRLGLVALEAAKLVDRELEPGSVNHYTVHWPDDSLVWSSTGPRPPKDFRGDPPKISGDSPQRFQGTPPKDFRADSKGNKRKEIEGKETEELDAPRPNEPLILVEALCEVGEFDINALIDSERGRWFGTAKRLVTQGVSAADVKAFVAYRKTTFRTDMPTMLVVAKEIGAWIAAGRPTHAVQKNGHKGRVPWSEIGRQLDERDRRQSDNPFDMDDGTIEVEVRDVR